jgi:hypothetical protein
MICGARFFVIFGVIKAIEDHPLLMEMLGHNLSLMVKIVSVKSIPLDQRECNGMAGMSANGWSSEVQR